MSISDEYIESYSKELMVDNLKSSIVSSEKTFEVPSRALWVDFKMSELKEELNEIYYNNTRDEFIKFHHKALSKAMGNDYIVKLVRDEGHTLEYLVQYKLDFN